MTTLTDFLLARIAEDEADANACRDWCECDECPAHPPVARVLAECEAKRRLVETCSCIDIWVLMLLALPYADHPDCRQEWKP